jgi:hypothetical protein
MTYLSIRDEAVKQIRAGIPDPKITIEAHPGLFTETTLRQSAQRSPAILTSMVRATDGRGQNSITFVSWVLYRASSADKLYDGALKIVSALIPVIRKADFELVIRDTNITAECLYTGALDALNVTLWAVKWELVLGDRVQLEVGTSLEDLEQGGSYGGTTMVGSVEMNDHINMEE